MASKEPIMFSVGSENPHYSGLNKLPLKIVTVLEIPAVFTPAAEDISRLNIAMNDSVQSEI